MVPFKGFIGIILRKACDLQLGGDYTLLGVSELLGDRHLDLGLLAGPLNMSQ